MTDSTDSVANLRDVLRASPQGDRTAPRASLTVRLRRTAGWLFLFIAALGVVLTILLTATGQSFFFVSIGQLWFNPGASSLNGAEAGIQRYLWPPLWDGLIVPVPQSAVWQLLAIMVVGGGALGVALLSMPWSIRIGWPIGTRSRYHEEDILFMPDVAAAARRGGSRLAYLLSIITLVFALTFVIWADLAVLDEVPRGEAKVVPSSRVQIVQNLEGGILSAILVREGSIVEQGDILVRIDNVTAASTYRENRRRYLNLLASIARLKTELSQAEEIEFPPEVLAEAPEAAQLQRGLLISRRSRQSAQGAILQAQSDQRKQEIAEMNSRRRQLESSLSLAREEYAITEPLVRQGIMPRLDLIRIQRQMSDLEGELRTLRLSVPRAETALREAEQRVAELRAGVSVEAGSEYSRQRAELDSLGELMAAGGDRVTRSEVRSPVRGTVKELKVNTVGGVIQPGADIMEIVPLADTLLIEAKVRPADIAFLRPGQSAVVKITAYDFSIYGGLDAIVEQIGGATIQDEQGEHYYHVQLRTEQTDLAHKGEALPIIPGMTATVDIMTGEKSVLDYLLKPILKTRDRALRER